jgi:hypothetical protein
MNISGDTRVELLAALAELGRIRPEWRLGQTMANLAMTAGRMESGGAWDLEDAEALAAARLLIQQHYEIGSGAAEPVATPDLGSDATFGQTQGVAGGPGR